MMLHIHKTQSYFASQLNGMFYKDSMMNFMIVRFCFIFVCAVFFTVNIANASEINRILKTQTKPTNAIKAKIVNAARDYLYDPYSVRDAEISAVLTLDAKRDFKAVCVKANAKNQYGGYTGRQVVSVRILKGQLVGTYPNAPACRAQGLRWYRFKELERLRDL